MVRARLSEHQGFPSPFDGPKIPIVGALIPSLTPARKTRTPHYRRESKERVEKEERTCYLEYT
jgi:hypothetical protein